MAGYNYISYHLRVSSKRAWKFINVLSGCRVKYTSKQAIYRYICKMQLSELHNIGVGTERYLLRATYQVTCIDDGLTPWHMCSCISALILLKIIVVLRYYSGDSLLIISTHVTILVFVVTNIILQLLTFSLMIGSALFKLQSLFPLIFFINRVIF